MRLGRRERGLVLGSGEIPAASAGMTVFSRAGMTEEGAGVAKLARAGMTEEGAGVAGLARAGVAGLVLCGCDGWWGRGAESRWV